MQPVAAGPAQPAVYSFKRLIDLERPSEPVGDTQVKPGCDMVAVWACMVDGQEVEIGGLVQVTEAPDGIRVKCSIRNALPGAIYEIMRDDAPVAEGTAPCTSDAYDALFEGWSPRTPRFLAYAPIGLVLPEAVFDASLYAIRVLVPMSALRPRHFPARETSPRGGGEVFAFNGRLPGQARAPRVTLLYLQLNGFSIAFGGWDRRD